MLLIGAINVGLGYCSYDGPPPPPQKINLVLPPSTYATDAGIDAPPAPPAHAPPAPPAPPAPASPAPAPPTPAPPTAR